jgi:hypothetical protein
MSELYFAALVPLGITLALCILLAIIRAIVHSSQNQKQLTILIDKETYSILRMEALRNNFTPQQQAAYIIDHSFGTPTITPPAPEYDPYNRL